MPHLQIGLEKHRRFFETLEGHRMITGLHHFSIIASSKESIFFYTKLGFIEKKRIKRSYDTVVLMYGYGIGLEIFVDPTHQKLVSNHEPLGLRSLSLRVKSCDEMREHFECGPTTQDWFGVNYCVTFDPDGLQIQFHE